ncbi:MAG: flagellar motor switch protein FliG [Burkholderiaceae bacterium]|nr:MAG: flagellar motor switch protein FliG [Burkholderiaceae bacterium]
MNDEGVNDSAILLMSLGEEEASEVFKHLSPKEVQKLGAAMAQLKSVSRDRVKEVIQRFTESVGDASTVGMDSNEYIRTVLTKALGEEKASFLIDRILQGGDTSGIEGLKWMDAPTVAELIKNEHPQIIASILVHLERDHAAEILNKFTERTRNDVLLRIATLEGIQPSALRELNESLARVLSSSQDQIKKTAMGGVRTAAEILNFSGTSQEQAIVESIREYDPDLAQKILDEMFVFDNIMDIDDRGIQSILREVQSEGLIIALKGASQDIREKIFRNMSSRAAEMLRDDLESKGPVKLSDVEREQKEILKVVRRLAEEGQIVLGGKGEEQYV